MGKLRANSEIISDKSKNPVTTSTYIKHGNQWLDDAVNNAIGAAASKADKTYVDSELTKKANKSDIDAALSSKADKSELSTESAALSARMDEFTKLEEGSTTGDAELTDGRVGADGKTYTNIGGAIRGQVTDLKSDLNYSKIIRIIDFSDAQNGYVDKWGYLRTDAYNYITVELNAYETVRFKGTANTSAAVFAMVQGDQYNVLSIGTSVSNDTYEYTASEDCTIVISYDHGFSHYGIVRTNIKNYVDDNLEKLHNEVENKIYLDFSSATAGYVDKWNTLQSDSGYIHTEPFELKIGEKIKINASGYKTYVSMLAKVNDDGTYTSLVNSVENVTSYEYTSLKDINVIVSVSASKPYEAFIKTTTDSQAKRKSTEIGFIPNYFNLFKKVGVIGDSLSSGLMYVNGENEQHKYNYSWLSNIAKFNNCECVHYSRGGLKCNTWLSSDFYSQLASDEKCNAYYIALGTNDGWNVTYEVGSIDDTAGTDSFVGYYKQIIEYVKSQAPNAVIFCLSSYSTTIGDYFSMVKPITELYDNCYYIDFSNEGRTQLNTCDSTLKDSSHYTTMGYLRVGEEIQEITNRVIANNIDDFKYFAINN